MITGVSRIDEDDDAVEGNKKTSRRERRSPGATWWCRSCSLADKVL